MARTSYDFHHQFPKLAEESGFSFNIHRPRVHVDWNKFRSIDIDSVIKERKFYLIEQYLNDILYCVLESEFDVRILDEGFLKMFRLAQLAVEYQQFCRHYLDRSVFVLKEEVTGLAQELHVTKKNLQEKDEEIRKLKRKSKPTYRTPLPYGNDNIATMILKTLSHKSDIFGIPTTSNPETMQYNKCSYCNKVFLNQLYLKSHLSRRHSNMLDVPEKDTSDNVQTTNDKDSPKLNEEIEELKAKLKEMENLLLKVHSETSPPVPLVIPETKPDDHKQDSRPVEKIITKDAEVSTNLENNLLDKIEEWKKEEHVKYNTEINLLRTQIVDIVNSFKNKDVNHPSTNEFYLIEQLNTTIQQQGAEIHLLKQELSNAIHRTEKEDLKRKMEVENQMSIWVQRVEQQTQQYEALLQKLNDVAIEAREARSQAETERARAAQLQVLLQENLDNKVIENECLETQNGNAAKLPNGDVKKKIKRKQKPNPEANPKTLETLHRKAQELLNLRPISSSDISSSSVETPQNKNMPKNLNNIKKISERKLLSEAKSITHRNQAIVTKNKQQKDLDEENAVVMHQKLKKEKSKAYGNNPSKIGNGPLTVHGSPIKLVRAKITEEVNSRLVTIGVDPLKNRLPKSYFQKQKLQLQQQHERKSKKNPEYQKMKHSILAYLDSNTPVKKKAIVEIEDYVSPNKISKAFSLSSVITNVKNKALSLVKSHDTNVISKKRKEINAGVAKKAMSFLKTPPSSVPSSPVKLQKVEVIKAARSTDEAGSRGLRKNNITAQATIDREPQHLISRKKINGKAVTTEEDSSESDFKYNSAISQSTKSLASQSTKSIENLIKSPARRPFSASAVDYNGSLKKLLDKGEETLLRSQSAINIAEYKDETNHKQNATHATKLAHSSDEIESLVESPIKKPIAEGNILKHTKGVLKNASSTSSLNKKKVLFDMDAIQMKSVSASPSQSITEKNDNNEKFELGLINLDGEEWDISSIENDPIKEETKIQVNTRTSPKIAELKQTIESQMARRYNTPSTTLAGGVNILPPAIMRTSSIAGSNTSLGSSILDESDGVPIVKHKAFVRSKKVPDKSDSEIDISEYSLDGIAKKANANDSF